MDTSPVQEKNLVFVGQFLVRAFLYGPYLTKIFVKNMLVIRPVQFKGEKCTGLIFQQKFFKKKVVLLYGHNEKKIVSIQKIMRPVQCFITLVRAQLPSDKYDSLIRCILGPYTIGKKFY